jgi:hypothetical protein
MMTDAKAPPTKPEPEAVKPPRPDAVMVPAEFLPRPGTGTIFSRVGSMADLVEPLLGCEHKTERAYMRKLPRDQGIFCTRDPHDTIVFPTGHALEGQPRYRWVSQPDGIELGYLVPESSRAAR